MHPGSLFSYRRNRSPAAAEQGGGPGGRRASWFLLRDQHSHRQPPLPTAHLAISSALFIMFNTLPRCNEEEFCFSASLVNLVDFGDFLMP